MKLLETLAAANGKALGDMGQLMSLRSSLAGVFSDVDLPPDVRKDLTKNVSIKETISWGGFRFLPSPAGSEHQGYVALVLKFLDAIEVNVSCADVSVPSPVVARLRMQPYTYAGRVYLTPLDAGIYHKVDDAAPASVDASCLAKHCAPDDLDLEKTFATTVTSGLDPGIQVAIARLMDNLLYLLTHSMVVGGWVFGRDAAIDELDLRRDSLKAQVTDCKGDNDPADEVQRLRVEGNTAGGGFAALDYLER